MEHNKVSDSVKESLEIYVKQGIMPGSFLSAVLENNLCGALGAADSYNRASLFEIVQYIYVKLPHYSWGSREKVNKYVEKLNSVEK